VSEYEENGVPLAAFRQGRDVYIIYSFEEVAFHWEHDTRRVWRRFLQEGRQSATESSNRLFTDAQLYGRLASRLEYDEY
jgi:hypothetical protein